ncbi:Stk1 family PASTA domain-containing Ser/Thr kinase [Shouchella shacheensis]|uniref:Stk1 family PASTA domain-containing Ser/Thr kinase n=1 Tax=Shouchella shacheensis TaxID=1649580 RepID=UPI00074027CF|nr:Stk1 family PASTA domain-containing Ser/Thr kinase [Shouchella shacheensis]
MIGKRIGGRYEVLENIGGGGMANVYLALDVILDRHVAVKVLQPQFSEDDQFIRRFRREAQAATSLTNPNIVNIYDVGEEENVYYIVMEYVKGRTLKQVIQEEGPLPVGTALNYFNQILSGVGHAHANHIVHRDMKPQNILISETGEAKVTDFGIARAMSSATITHTNSVMGSVHYLSPEQARGGHVTYRSDLYSLGIVLFEMLTGQIPFSGDTAVSIAIKHLQNDLPSARLLVPEIPQSVENIINKATMKDPLNRFESTEEMAHASEVALLPESADVEPFNAANDDEEATKAIPILGNPSDGANSDATTSEVEDEDTKETQPAPENTALEPKKPKKKKKWFAIILITLFLLVGGGVLAFTVLFEWLAVDDVDVPDVVGSEYAEAEEMLAAEGLSVVRVDEANENVESGHVISQDPSANRSVKEGTEVTLYVSEVEEEIEMDDYSGLDINQAETILEEQGMTVNRSARGTNEYEVNTVIDQYPEAGENVVPTETSVTLTYAEPQQITLDNLVSLPEEEAREYLGNEGLRVRVNQEHSDSVPEGMVIRQSPEPYSSVESGANVNLVISLGPEESEDPTSEPEIPGETVDEEDPPEENGEDEEEPSRVFEVTQPIQVSEQDTEAGREFEIRIMRRDAQTEGEDELYLEETITESTEFTINLTVTPTYSGSFDLYVDDELMNESEVLTYEEE